MKKYHYQLTTGAIVVTEQEITFTAQGYSIDNQASTPEESILNGKLLLPAGYVNRDIHDLVFQSKDIVLSWIEE